MQLHLRVLQCVAACCSVLQSVALEMHIAQERIMQMLLRVLQCVACAAVSCSKLQHATQLHLHIVCCSVLQCVAVCCSVLQCVAVCCSELQCVTVRCSALQCVAVCCSELQ